MEKKQIQTVFAFTATFVIIGIPVWWKTTEVYRSTIPYSQISVLSSLTVTILINVPFYNFDETVESYPDVQKMMNAEDNTLDNSDYDGLQFIYRYTWNNFKDNSKFIKEFEEGITVEKFEEILLKSGFVDSLQNKNEFRVIIIPKIVPLKKPFYLGISSIFIHSSHIIDHDLNSITDTIKNFYIQERVLQASFFNFRGSRRLKNSVKLLGRAVKPNPGYSMTFTILNSNPVDNRINWDFEKIEQIYLNKFLKPLRRFFKVSIQSQILNYISPNFKVKKVGNQFYLEQDDLPHLLNPIERKLRSHVSGYPELNFILYIPSKSEAPLYIKDAELNSFISPRWGGFLVYNLNKSMSLNYTDIFGIFLAQAEQLLGFPQIVDNDKVEYARTKFVTEQNWELTWILLNKALQNYGTSILTLSSLSQLISQIPNMVINDEIGNEVAKSVSSCEDTLNYLNKGAFTHAFDSSKTAFIFSEKAFFDPSLLGLLYFPEDQKFAIYVPLFVPVGLPMALSTYFVIKYLIYGQKEKGD